MAEHFTLKNNLIFVLAEAAGGVYNSDQMRMLCEVADNESAFLKITEDQRIGFMLDPNKLPEIQSQVRKCGIILRSYKAAGVPSPRACLGELCTFSQQPSLGDALELTTHLLKSFPSPKRHSTIGINGCGRACLGSSTEDIHVVAEESGYKISIGGKGSEIPQQAQLLLENVPRAELPVVLERLLAVFYQESAEDERIYDVIERIGLTPFFNSIPEHLMPAMHETEELNAPVENETEVHSSDDESSENSTDLINIDATLGDFDEQSAASDGSGLIEGNDSLIIDELIEQSAKEFTENIVEIEPISTDIDLSESDLSEPMVDIDSDLANEAFATQELTAEDESEDVPADSELLEDADFEDGTLDDVSRIRDAIRTELSMSVAETEKLSGKPVDLLDEIEADGSLDASDEASDEFGLTEQSMATAEDTQSPEFESDFEATGFQYEESSQFETEEETRSSPSMLSTFENESNVFESKPVRRRNSKVSSAAQFEEASLPPHNAQTVKGRLSIRFLDQQLAVELPSGMCFELPLDAVQEGNQFSMELPDGELIMEREGSTLMVKLGLLQMKFPIPNMPPRRVA